MFDVYLLIHLYIIINAKYITYQIEIMITSSILLIITIQVIACDNLYLIYPLNRTSMSVKIPVEGLNLSESNLTETSFTIDTMSFYSFIYLDYVMNKNSLNVEELKQMNSINSYRSFSGYLYKLLFPNYKNDFPFVIFKDYYFNEKRYIQHTENTSCGFFGLARNYTEDVLIDEKYFFGVKNEYSIMNYLIGEKAINKNIFAIYKDNFIIGKSFSNDEKYSNFISKCQCSNELERSYKYFFWNCEMTQITFMKQVIATSSYNSIIIDTILEGIIFPRTVLYEIIETLQTITVGKCEIDVRIICRKDVDLNIFGKMQLQLTNYFTIEIDLPSLFYYNQNDNIYYSYIEFSDYSEGITIGRTLFNHYFVEFNAQDNFVALGKLTELNINLQSNTNESLQKSLLLIINVLQIVTLIYLLFTYYYIK